MKKSVLQSVILSGGNPMSAPTAAMGWRGYWDYMDITKTFSDNGVTQITADGLMYRTNEILGTVANAQFVQATDTNRPTYKAGGANNKNYAQHDSTDDFMASLAISNFFANNAKTILIAGAIRAGWANGDQVVWDASGYFGVNVVTGNLLRVANWPGGAYGNSTGSAFVNGQPFIFLGKHDGGKLYDAINGVAWTTGVTSGNTTAMTGLLRTGVQAAAYTPLDLYALAVANVVISDWNLALCVNYFKAQLGI